MENKEFEHLITKTDTELRDSITGIIEKEIDEIENKDNILYRQTSYIENDKFIEEILVKDSKSNKTYQRKRVFRIVI